MAEIKSPLTPLIDQLCKLPGVGAKSAQRLAFHLISVTTQEVEVLANVLTKTRTHIKYCKSCFNISFETTCFICSSNSRDKTQLCIVAEPKDIYALERANEYNGLYHVLGGYISPLDGVYPESLRIEELILKLKKSHFNEVIIAINSSIEGDATTLYLKSCLKNYKNPISQLAYGLPVGAELDYTDESTLQKAFSGRQKVK
ncbi:recombination protein RecR [Candidatus Marinamargulisbacteria bacterium SCGC AG-410-N11]|nr:recombination protein RecR [Candidatus Marinamargulisbacteria bacterium SCGC AG-410-N11]